MILQCPNCTARFIVPPQAIGPEGRRVRCARCLNIWHAELGEGSHEVVPEFVDAIAGKDARSDTEAETSAQSADETRSDQTDLSEVEALAQKLAEKISGPSATDEPEPGEMKPREPETGQEREPEDIVTDDDDADHKPEEVPEEAPATTTLPALIEPRSRFLVIGWVTWGVFVAGFLLSMFFFREPIVEAWPPGARLYEIVGLMEPIGGRLSNENQTFRGALKIRNQAEPRANSDGTFDLIISGSIENTTAKAIRLPRIIGVLRDADKQTILEWRVDLTQSSIGPRGRLEFRTEVPSVPPATTEYEILPDW